MIAAISQIVHIAAASRIRSPVRLSNAHAIGGTVFCRRCRCRAIAQSCKLRRLGGVTMQSAGRRIRRRSSAG